MIKITVQPKDITPELKEHLTRQKQRIEVAIRRASTNLARSVIRQGRQDIQSAGKFGPRWTTGFTYDISGEGKETTITFNHAVSYWRVFQYGAVIRGKPLLWIPLPGVRPGERGDFFQKSKAGNLLLFQKHGRDAIRPLRVAKESVTIPKKFHLVEIIQAETKTLGRLYRTEMEGG